MNTTDLTIIDNPDLPPGIIDAVGPFDWPPCNLKLDGPHGEVFSICWAGSTSIKGQYRVTLQTIRGNDRDFMED